MSVNITWLGHSCFLLECGGYRVVLDPYKDEKVPGLGPVRVVANQVICSHDHDDHNWVQAVNLVDSSEPSPFSIELIQTYHDEEQGALRGGNRITVMRAQGVRIAHFGDLGVMLSDQQLEQLMDIDVALIPVGGYYTIDAKTANLLTTVIRARVVIPMHYRSETFGFDLIDTVDRFLELRSNVVRYKTNQITVDQETRSQTALLTYLPAE